MTKDPDLTSATEKELRPRLLRDREMKVNTLRELQSQTQEELDAMLPSVLDKAFKGEL